MMQLLADFHFLRPWWLSLGLLLPLGIWWSSRERQARGWDQFCDAALLPFILVERRGFNRNRRGWILAAVWLVLGVLALAGPTFERLPVPVFRNLSPLVLVLDLSDAMRAADLKPSRLERIRYKLDDLLRERKGGQTALVVFAGDAFTVTPLTDDAGTLSAQLDALSPDIMPVPGSNAASGLELGKKLIQQAGQRHGDLLLVTSGTLGKREDVALDQLHENGFRVSVLGVGTSEGAPIPLPGGGFLKEASGRLVLSRLDSQALWNAAQRGGGVYRSLSQDGSDIADILNFLARAGARSEEDSEKLKLERWKDAGIWLLPLLGLIALFGLRRSSWLWFVFFLVLPWSPPSFALSWDDLWKTRDQQGMRAFDAGDSQKAESLFESPEWKSAAAYRANDFKGAEALLKGIDTASALYNRGNALARSGDLEEALAIYEAALKQKPGDEDTIYNQNLVKEALKQKEKQDSQSREDSKSKGSGQSSGEGHSKTPSSGSQGAQNGKPDAGDSAPDASKPPPSGSPQTKEPNQSADSKPQQGSSSDSNDSGKDQQDPTPPQPSGSGVKPPKASTPEESPSKGLVPPTQADSKNQAPPAASGSDAPERSDEAREIEGQWLRSIPDDPGGLLKRKFYLQYRQRQGASLPPPESK